FFPNSYKRPYQFEEVENANILKRAETLHKINSSTTSRLVVTFPEALTEKVINRKSLLNHTLAISEGEKIDLEFICEILVSYGFEKTEFVYEPGQFALRGGILDICSYGNELPYRLETFGDEVESIRTFDPYSQLSKENVKILNIIPNVQTQLLTEERQSLFDFAPPNTTFWYKDFELTHQVVEKHFDKASREFDKILKKSGHTKVISGPEILFESADDFIEKSTKFSRVEFGNKFYLQKDGEYLFNTEIQPPFHRNFEKISENLLALENEGVKMFIAGESVKQLERLEAIFEEIDSHIHFYPLNVGLRSGFIDRQLNIGCYTDHELFDRFFRYKGRESPSKSKAMTLRELNTLQIGDFVTHVDYGIGKFAGLEKKTVNGKIQEAIRLVYRDDDLLYINIHSLHKISRYSGKEGAVPAISKLGSPDWENKKKKVKKKVADIARELIDLYAKRKRAPGFTFSKDTYMQAELETGFLYEDTPDQVTSTAEVKEDMESPHPMDRLICGDVGFGKTEVAIRAAFKAVTDNKQVAVLVPTTILAMQHFRTFSERLSDFPVTIDYISRFKPQNEIKEILKKTGEGKVDILIGTHRIVSKDIKFKNIGLLIVDEEQKFGVKIKEKIKELKVNVDVLTLTATPIPRTLHFSLMGARDLSIIATPPPNRQPVTTEIHTFNDALIRDASVMKLEE
ncbi:MAG: DEAD/DEAH box helicase, partial [Cyclobacteriaceae bacterium]|nr:DEAD/DEAH box helicase [Cyclobacteriaceae bacterium]